MPRITFKTAMSKYSRKATAVLDSTNEMRPYAFVPRRVQRTWARTIIFFFMIELVTVCNVKSGTKYSLFFVTRSTLEANTARH